MSVGKQLPSQRVPSPPFFEWETSLSTPSSADIAFDFGELKVHSGHFSVRLRPDSPLTGICSTHALPPPIRGEGIA